MSNYTDTLGALLVSTFLGFFCSGAVAAQSLMYFSKWGRSDRIAIRVVVAASTLILLGNNAVFATWSYKWTVTGYGNTSVMLNVPFAFPLALLFMAVNQTFVQTFFAWRLKKIAGKSPYGCILPLFVLAMSLLQLVSMIVACHREFVDPAVANLPGIYTPGYIWCAGSVAADIAITGGMVYHLLWKTRNSPLGDISKTTLLNIVQRSFENNCICLVLQIFLTVMLTRGPGLWFTIVYTTICPAYAFSLLLSLNSRNPNIPGDFSFDANPAQSHQSSATRNKASVPAHGVNVSVTREARLEESCDEQKWDSQRVVQISRGPPPAVNIRFDGVTVHGVRTIKEKGEDTDLEMQTL